jgi:hypothetical protein
MVAAAVVGGSAITAGAGMFSSSRASSQQQGAANRATDAQMQMYQTSRGDLSPYNSMGMGAMQEMGAMMGMDWVPDVPATADPNNPGSAGGPGNQGDSGHGFGDYFMNAPGTHIPWVDPGINPGAAIGWMTGAQTPQQVLNDAFHRHNQSGTSPGMIPGMGGHFVRSVNPGAGMQAMLERLPGYQFTKEQGLRAVENSFGARGLTNSSAALRGVADYTTGLADQTFGQQFNRLLDMTRLGESAAAQTGTFGSSAASGMSNSLLAGGNAAAAGTLGVGNAIGGFGNSLGSAAMYNQLLHSGMYNGG